MKNIFKPNHLVALITLVATFYAGNMLSRSTTTEQRKAIAQQIISQKQNIDLKKSSNIIPEQPKTPAQNIIAETEKAFKKHNYYRTHPEKGSFSDDQKFEHLDYNQHFDIILEYVHNILPEQGKLRNERDELRSQVSKLAWKTQSWMQWLRGEETEELKNLKNNLSSVEKKLNQIDKEYYYAKAALEFMYLQKYNKRLSKNELYHLLYKKYH